LLIASFPLLLLYNTYNIQLLLLNKWVLYAIIVVMSWLMVSKLSLLNLKFKTWGFAENKASYALLILAVAGIALLNWLAVPFIFLTYIAVSLLFKNKTT
jgi:CDP-diacylglycerol--serine O-phosphatidyltransferase